MCGVFRSIGKLVGQVMGMEPQTPPMTDPAAARADAENAAQASANAKIAAGKRARRSLLTQAAADTTGGQPAAVQSGTKTATGA